MSFKKIKIGNYLKTEPEIFGTIRANSKYIDQQGFDQMGRPIPFKVTLNLRCNPHYCVHGNDNQYRLCDLDLWIKLGEKLETLPLHEPIYRIFCEEYP